MVAFYSIVASFIEATDGKPLYERFWPWLRAEAQRPLYEVFSMRGVPCLSPELVFFDVLSVELGEWQESHQ
jgi:hypothetical protein